MIKGVLNFDPPLTRFVVVEDLLGAGDVRAPSGARLAALHTGGVATVTGVAVGRQACGTPKRTQNIMRHHAIVRVYLTD